MEIVHVLRTYLASEVEEALKDAIAPVAPYLRQVSIGALTFLLSAGALSLSLLFFGGALFFSLADFDGLAVAAVWSAFFFLVLGGILTSIGWNLIRAPRD